MANGFVTCTKLETELAAKQDKLNGCNGQPLAVGATVPTCADVDAAISAVENALAAEALTRANADTAEATARANADAALQTAINAKQGQLKDCAGNNHAANATVPSCAEMTAADTAAVASAVNQAAANIDNAIDALLAPSAEFEAAVKASETPTSFVLGANGNYVHTNEAGVQGVLQPGNLMSADAGQSLVTGSDGKLFVNVIALLPDGTTFSGSNNGNVDITIVSDISDPNMKTVEANLDLATETPTNGVNLLKESAAGFYVSGDEIETELDLVDRFAAKQGALKGCDDAPLPAGTTVATCDELAAEAQAREEADDALQTAVDGKQDQIPDGANGQVWTATTANPAGSWQAVPASTQRAVATTAQSQAWTANDVDLTPLRLNEAFRGNNQPSAPVQRLPGGWLIQRGTTGPSSSTASTVVTFPVAFSAPPTVVLSAVTHDGSTAVSMVAQVPTATGFRYSVFNSGNARAAGLGSEYIAIGRWD